MAHWLRFWFVFNSYLNERLHKYDGCDIDMNIKQNSKHLRRNLAYKFNNFMYVLSLSIIILKFVKIPWPNVHMNNLECFYHVLTNLILLYKNTQFLKKRE